MRPRSRGDGPSDVVGSAGPADADSRVFSPRVETRAANSTSESDALDRTSSTATADPNWTSGAAGSLTPDTLDQASDIPGCAGAEGVVEDGRARLVELPALAVEALQGRERFRGAERGGRLDDEVARIVVQAREQRRQRAGIAAEGEAEQGLAGGVPVGVVEARRQRVADGAGVFALELTAEPEGRPVPRLPVGVSGQGDQRLDGVRAGRLARRAGNRDRD